MTLKPIRHESRSQLVAALAAVTVLGACSSTTYSNGVPYCAPVPPPPVPLSYALVEYRPGAVAAQTKKPEVRETDGYKANRTTYKSVAIHVPDGCAETSGPAAAPTILSSCAVYVSELERALTRHDYRVVSWAALRALERQKSLAPYAAGKELGADIVFVFNSLDIAPIEAGGAVGASFRFFVSDEKGTRREPLALDEATRTKFREFANTHAGAVVANGVVALSSTIDSTAIATNAAEPVWVYRRNITKPVPPQAGMRFLFGRTSSVEGGRTEQPWTPATPQGKSDDGVRSEVSGGVADPYATQKLELMQEAARDFVTRFHDGER